MRSGIFTGTKKNNDTLGDSILFQVLEIDITTAVCRQERKLLKLLSQEAEDINPKFEWLFNFAEELALDMPDAIAIVVSS